MRPVRPMTSAY